jgi:hypothetical protein
MTSPSAGQGQDGPSFASGGAPEVAVAVVDADQAARSRLAMQLGQGATPFASVEDLVSRLLGTPVVVVLGPSYQDPMALQVVESLLAEHREVGAVLVTTELTTELLQAFLEATGQPIVQGRH